MRCSMAGCTMALSRRRRRRLRDLPIMQCCAPQLARRTLPEPEILNRFAAARLLFILGMSGSSHVGRLGGISVVHGSGPPGGQPYDG